MSNIQQGFPQLSSPIADQTNIFRVTQPWQQFFISLWNRTGAQQGNATFIPGFMVASASADIPLGWLLCNGSAVSRTVYVALFNSIGGTWGTGDGVTTFNLPDLRTRAAIGYNNTFPIGSTGGHTNITLSLANLPTHSHSISDPGHTHNVSDPSHTHTITDPGHAHTSIVASSVNTTGTDPGAQTSGSTNTATTGITINSAMTGISIDNATTGISTNNTGGGAPFSAISPYAALSWLIKT